MQKFSALFPSPTLRVLGAALFALRFRTPFSGAEYTFTSFRFLRFESLVLQDFQTP